MSWKSLLANNRVEPHTTSRQEVDALRAAVDRNLRDAALTGLSVDNRFSLAYEAVLLLAKMGVPCAGYRVRGYGAHQTTLVALEAAMGAGVSQEISYSDACRRRRNTLSYEMAGIVAETEALELLERARQFRQAVEAWIAKHHPNFSRTAP